MQPFEKKLHLGEILKILLYALFHEKIIDFFLKIDSCHISGGSHTLVLHPGESIPGGHMLGVHTPGGQLPKW